LDRQPSLAEKRNKKHPAKLPDRGRNQR